MLKNKRFLMNTFMVLLGFAIILAILVLLPIPKSPFWITNGLIYGGLMVINYGLMSYQFFNTKKLDTKFLSVPLIQLLATFFGVYALFMILFTYILVPVFLYWILLLVIILVHGFLFYRLSITIDILNKVEEKSTKGMVFKNQMQSLLIVKEASFNSALLKKKVLKIKEEFNYVDPISTDKVKDIEKEMLNVLTSLEVDEDEQVTLKKLDRIEQMVKTRTSLLKK
jgi:hypothetical protein